MKDQFGQTLCLYRFFALCSAKNKLGEAFIRSKCILKEIDFLTSILFEIADLKCMFDSIKVQKQCAKGACTKYNNKPTFIYELNKELSI